MTRPAAPRPEAPGTLARRRWVSMWLVVLMVVAGLAHALRVAWVTDDAFLSFRYAENLVRGLGLVFNAGERVEGYSNFLWTLWSAAGIALGVDPVRWSMAWGLTCYAATLALLGRFTLLRARERMRAADGAGAGAAARRGAALAVPLAAVLGATHGDWAIFATSGLETSSFTLLVLAGWLLTLGAPARPRRAAAAGVVLALAALSRPDGVLFAAVAGAFLAVRAPRRGGTLLAFAASLVLVLAPYAAWKLSYYGDLLPNTYYAKSAGRAWWSQGLVYVGLYFAKYWVLALGALACIGAAWRGRTSESSASVADSTSPYAWGPAAALAAAFVLVYTLYVARVGGDFMFARLLIPVTPLLLVLAELAFERVAPLHSGARIALAIALLAAVAYTPYPFRGQGWVRGIANEWAFYTKREQERSRAFGLELRRMFDGLPIRMAFCGGQAVLAYYSRAPLAIETATGLTDSTIAHQPLGARLRPGHEKKTPIPYLIARGTQFWMYSGSLLSDSLARYIPLVPLQLDTLTVMAITWDPPVMDSLRARGAKVTDFGASLAEFVRVMPALPDSTVRDAYEKTRRFYLDHARDPQVEAAFAARLGRAAPR